jgi:DHA1 family multidrug resistance protein-like MFS transporter
MEIWRRNLYLMLITVFVGQASFTLITPFLPYVLKSMEVVDNLGLWSGMAYSASFFTTAIMAPVWGSVADKYGKRLQLLRSGLGIALTYALYPLARTPAQFVLMRGLTGFLSGFVPACTSLIATGTPDQNMGYALGLFQAASAAGTISGPLVGGIMFSAMGMHSTFRLAAVILTVFTVVPFLLLKEEVAPSPKPIRILGDLKEAFTNKHLVMVFLCLFLVQAGIQATQPTLTLYIDMIAKGKDSTVVNGIIYSMAGLGTVIGATLTARRGANTSTQSHMSAFLVGLLGSAVFVAAQGIWVQLLPIAGLRLIFGAFNGILTVAGNVLVATAVTKEFRGRAFGVMNGVLPMGSVVGPLLGGMVGDALGLGSSFYVASMVFLLATGLFSLYTRRISNFAEKEAGVSSKA